VEKVISLLEGLREQVEKDGKREATEYDKFSCFCKEQADNKQYAIEKSTAKIAELNAKIDALTAEINDLTASIKSLGVKINDLADKIAKAEAARAKDHADYLVKEKDASDAIDAVARAIKALNDSKGDLTGKVAMEEGTGKVAMEDVSLLQSYALRMGASQGQVAALEALAQAQQPGQAYTYTYHSNDIIATLEGLLKKFGAIKARLDQEEFDANSAFEKKRLGLQNEKKFAEQEKAEEEAELEAKSEELAATEADKTQETKEMTADQEFLAVVKGNCEDKAAAWDQRSTARAAELTAITKALDILKSGAAPAWKANRKLVDLQNSAHSSAPTSFLQVRSGNNAKNSQKALTEQALQLITTASKDLRSPVLSAVSMKMRLAADHFVKVRTLIKDIISRLEAQKAAEATQKTFCDGAMKAAMTKRDDKKAQLEDLATQISAKETKKAELMAEIADLSAAIAANKKALNEATLLRTEENADNTAVVAEAGGGKDAVELALRILKSFYQGSSPDTQSKLAEPVLMQKSAYVPPNSDREGNTVADLAPEVFKDEKYAGRQPEAKGIIGILEVMLADFDRTGVTVTSQEQLSESQFQSFKTTNENDTAEKEKAVADKESEVTTIKDDLVNLGNMQKEASDILKTALTELDDLTSMCVEGEETYEERVAKREKEIAALKEALVILENWQS
jgi:chromosome segregation ATPase